MLFSYLFYKMTKEGLLADDGMFCVGLFAAFEVMAELGIIWKLIT